MKKYLYIVSFLFSLNSFSQSYYFDTLIIGKYYGKTVRHSTVDTTIISICSNDTMTIDESIYPANNYLNCEEKCWAIYKGGGGVKHFQDTSFIRLPAACQCFNGKYFGFNDSLRLKYYSPPDWQYFYWFYGRKYWSPITGSIGIKENIKEQIVFDVFPNPSAGKVSLVFENGYLPKNRRGIICDINGKTVMEFEISSIDASSIINTNGMAAGVYIVKIEDHERSFVRRFVIAK